MMMHGLAKFKSLFLLIISQR